MIKSGLITAEWKLTDAGKIVETINPKILIPIHTESALKFKEFHDNVKIVKNGEKVEV